MIAKRELSERLERKDVCAGEEGSRGRKRWLVEDEAKSSLPFPLYGEKKGGVGSR